MKIKLLVVGITTSLVMAISCAPVPGEVPIPLNTALFSDANITPTDVVITSPTEVVLAMTQIMTETLPITVPATEVAGKEITLTIHTEKETGSHLADERGRSLYVYMNDTPKRKLSTCIDDCAVEWPPLIVSGTPIAGKGVNAVLVGTLIRDDGSMQATYNGWPLYYYNMDTIPGTMYGQRYKGIWFLVSPSGEPIR